METKRKKRLWECKTEKEVLDWVEDSLKAGHTISDPYFFVNSGSSVEPKKVMRKLRKRGLNIEECCVSTTDAAGTVHPKTLAWRVASGN